MGQTSEVVPVEERLLPDVTTSDERSAAFRTLAETHLDRAYGLAVAILRNPTDAQDATHDAFVQAWQKWSTLRDPDRFGQWFDRILVNICRNRLQRSRRWQMKDISEQMDLVSGDQYGPSDDRDLIGAAVATLSPDHQVIVALRYYQDLTVDEIARRLSIPTGTAQSRLHYALQALHAALDLADQKGAAQ